MYNRRLIILTITCGVLALRLFLRLLVLLTNLSHTYIYPQQEILQYNPNIKSFYSTIYECPSYTCAPPSLHHFFTSIIFLNDFDNGRLHQIGPSTCWQYYNPDIRWIYLKLHDPYTDIKQISLLKHQKESILQSIDIALDTHMENSFIPHGTRWNCRTTMGSQYFNIFDKGKRLEIYEIQRVYRSVLRNSIF